MIILKSSFFRRFPQRIKSRLWLPILGGLLLIFSSCIVTGDQRKPIDPKTLFTTGSDFLLGAKAVAIKGTIDFDGEAGSESGTFQLFINGTDSLSFYVEGPLKMDIFRMVILEDLSYSLTRQSSEWLVLGRDEVLEITDYGIENLFPFSLGHFIFPQFYCDDVIEGYSENLVVLMGDKMYEVHSPSDKKSFTILNRDLDLGSTYAVRRDYGAGFYPSKITVFSPGENWRIEVNIKNIRLNPRLSPRIWLRK